MAIIAIIITQSIKMATKKVLESKKKATSKKIDHKLVQQRAHENYLKRIQNGTPGDTETDWLQAEKELMKKTVLQK